MGRGATAAIRAHLQPLLKLTQRVGSDPLLTQASTGNSSIKLDGILWIKASGKWMADALRDEIFTPLDLQGVRDCMRRGVDPAEWYAGASLETALHAALPHDVVLHVHCVDTISWAVRDDAPMQLKRKLDRLRWQWLPYVSSGLPLACAIERALSASPDTNVFVLGNHGLVIAGENIGTVDTLLSELRKRLAISPRAAPPADLEVLREICRDPQWDLPDDDGLHTLGTEPISLEIVAKGFLYPCQAIFSDFRESNPFRPIGYPAPGGRRCGRYRDRPFLIVEGRGVLISKSITPPELAMLSGLAQVVRRLNSSSHLRYLTQSEVAGLSNGVAERYRRLCRMNRAAEER
jgi:rhamnose utilization protein RhaD (predicted bifunctional aldolase and dehydrogenase)